MTSFMGVHKYTCNRRDFISKGSLSLGSIVTATLPFSDLLPISSKMEKINVIPTLTGDIDPGKLGTTLMHEHVLFGKIPDNLRKASKEIAIKMLNDAARAGVHTVVDLTPYRDIHLYKEIAEEANLRIIASTGYYTRAKMPEYLQNMTELQMEDRCSGKLLRGLTTQISKPAL